VIQRKTAIGIVSLLPKLLNVMQLALTLLGKRHTNGMLVKLVLLLQSANQLLMGILLAFLNLPKLLPQFQTVLLMEALVSIPAVPTRVYRIKMAIPAEVTLIWYAAKPAVAEPQRLTPVPVLNGWEEFAPAMEKLCTTVTEVAAEP